MRAVELKKEDIGEVSLQSFKRSLRKCQFHEAFLIFSRQVVEDGEFGYTHRTSHGASGGGDQTSLQKEAQEVMSQLRSSHGEVFTEPQYPVDRGELF